MTEAEVVRRLIAENPWATIVSHNGEELVASHYPVLLDDRAAPEQLTVVTHVGRPDERVHDLGRSEVLLIVAGPHGYISPRWYGDQATRVPTRRYSTDNENHSHLAVSLRAWIMPRRSNGSGRREPR